MTAKRTRHRDLRAELDYHRRRVAAFEAALHASSSSRLRAVMPGAAPSTEEEAPPSADAAADPLDEAPLSDDPPSGLVDTVLDDEVAAPLADSAAHAKDEFLSAMSHELRTPLNAVLGACEALREGVYGPVPSAQDVIIQRVEESGRRLLSVIDAVLDFSALSAGTVMLARRPAPIDELCRAGLAEAREAAERKDLRVAFEITDGFVQVDIDRPRFVRALANLIANAVKFTPQGGAIGLVAVGDPANGRARFTVWDTGIGIADRDLPRLFRPFVQLDAGLSRRHGGAGLGLAIAHLVVELHGGSLTVTTSPGEGSRFTIDVPLRAPIDDRAE